MRGGGYNPLMLPDKLQVALKEWAVVQRALLEGRQIMLLRKGGLIEETGDFDLRARQFLIYPTYEHETERKGDIRPEFEAWLHEEEERKPAAGIVRIEAVCEVAEIIRANHAESLIHLAGEHIWSEQFIHGRFDWEPYKPVFLILVRAYQLAQPVELRIRPDYGGCRSWVSLEEPIPTAGAVPAISSKEDFHNRIEGLKKTLAG